MTTATKLVVAALMLAASNAAAKDNKVVADANQKVREFYGVPLNLKLWDLKKLRSTSELGWEMGEGDVYPTAKIVVNDSVTLNASFGSDGGLYMLETSSSGAVGPHGTFVGSTLEQVKKTWPSGRLIWGVNHGNRYVTFSTSTGIYYQFSPADLAPEAWADFSKDYEVDPSIKAITIRFAAIDEGQ
ncbi:MAG TPA: hypothetical protein VMN38_05205 [Sphingomicrobium sp.]|nr:hypothetical protein [Sphingomicrobium sp.]